VLVHGVRVFSVGECEASEHVVAKRMSIASLNARNKPRLLGIQQYVQGND
jgi:hypothetical protein